MSEGEIRTLVEQRLRQLRIEKLVGSLDQLEPLIVVTGGNPKAIGITLGLVKDTRCTLQQVLDDLYAARGELFDDLFARAWALLDEASRRVLMVSTFFPNSASGKVLGASADVHGYTFDRAVERLSDLALLDVQQADLRSHPRYTLHPLVRAFAGAKVVEHVAFEIDARERWLTWYLDFAQNRPWNPTSLQPLDDIEMDHDALCSVRQWAIAQQRTEAILVLAKSLDHYYYVRGHWVEKEENDLLRIEAARMLGLDIEEYEAIALHAQILGRQGKSVDALLWLDKLTALASAAAEDINLVILAAHAHFFVLQAQRNYRDALALLASIEVSIRESPSAPRRNLHIANRQWLALCHHMLGAHDEAKQLLVENLQAAIDLPYVRAISFHQRYLAEIALVQGDFGRAESLLIAALERAEQNKDPRQVALIYYSMAKLAFGKSEDIYAGEAIQKALNLFKRIGMRDEQHDTQVWAVNMGLIIADLPYDQQDTHE